MTMPIPGGYLDRQLLSRARRANAAARGIVGRILQDRPGPERLALMLAQIAHYLADQAEALNEMDRIRLEAKGGEEYGDPAVDPGRAGHSHPARSVESGGPMPKDPTIERLKQQNEKLERELRETREIVQKLEKLVNEDRKGGRR